MSKHNHNSLSTYVAASLTAGSLALGLSACGTLPTAPRKSVEIAQTSLPKGLHIRTAPAVQNEPFSNTCATLDETGTFLSAGKVNEVDSAVAGSYDPNGPWYEVSTTAFGGIAAAAVIKQCGVNEPVYVSTTAIATN